MNCLRASNCIFLACISTSLRVDLQNFVSITFRPFVQLLQQQPFPTPAPTDIYTLSMTTLCAIVPNASENISVLSSLVVIRLNAGICPKK